MPARPARSAGSVVDDDDDDDDGEGVGAVPVRSGRTGWLVELVACAVTLVG